jgi:hypothetical protein
MCESCDRTYLLAHHDCLKRIPNSESPYQIACAFKAKRYFNETQIKRKSPVFVVRRSWRVRSDY